MRQQYAWRSLVLHGFLAVGAAIILLQLVRIQVSAAMFGDGGKAFEGEWRWYFPERGEIYDRNGHLLAGNQTAYEVGVDLIAMRDPHSIAMAVSVNLNKDYDEVANLLLDPPEGISFVVLDNFANSESVAILEQLKMDLEQQEDALPSLEGLELNPRLQRSYPEESLASNVLGFVNREGRGYFGVEEKYNDLLAGQPTRIWVPSDPNRAVEIPRIPNGTSLILTINRDLQDAMEDILDNALLEYGAQQGAIIVMNPKNGEVLGMASTPRMDLNQFWNYGTIYNKASEFNRAVTMPYEPGSVFKILTMAAALDSGLVTPESTYLDTGAIEVGGITIKNWDEKAWGMQTMVGCLQHSLNVCLTWLAKQMEEQTFYGYMNRFGLGNPTGIDLAGEASGRLKIPGDEDWYEVDLGTNSFGQGVTVTPIQIMTAATAISNQGRMVSPHVLYAQLRDGHQFKVPIQHAGSPIKPETAATLNEMLAISLEAESSQALVPGYRVAGKTGTAQIPTPYGFYDSYQTNASFIGWGPVDDPQFMIYVWLERPSTSIWGSETAAPVFSEVAQKTVILLDIPPDVIRLRMNAQ